MDFLLHMPVKNGQSLFCYLSYRSQNCIFERREKRMLKHLKNIYIFTVFRYFVDIFFKSLSLHDLIVIQTLIKPKR